MPSKADHLYQSEHNEKLAVTLVNTAYLDWAATAFFYAALHYVEAFLAPAAHSQTHEERDSTIARNPTLAIVYKEYRALKTLSRQARYQVLRVQPEHIQAIRPKYEALKAHLLRLL